MGKKLWLNPDICNLLVNETKDQDTCSDDKTKCICEYYHARIFGGCGGCKAPGYKCKYTGKTPRFTKKCECTSTPNPSVPVS